MAKLVKENVKSEEKQDLMYFNGFVTKKPEKVVSPSGNEFYAFSVKVPMEKGQEPEYKNCLAFKEMKNFVENLNAGDSVTIGSTPHTKVREKENGEVEYQTTSIARKIFTHNKEKNIEQDNVKEVSKEDMKLEK